MFHLVLTCILALCCLDFSFDCRLLSSRIGLANLQEVLGMYRTWQYIAPWQYIAASECNRQRVVSWRSFASAIPAGNSVRNAIVCTAETQHIDL